MDTTHNYTQEQTTERISESLKLRLSLLTLFVGFESLTVIVSRFGLILSPLQWVQLGLAGAVLGCAVSYLPIGLFLRYSLTKVVPHGGGGEDVEPRYKDGWKGGPSTLIACPLCSSIWAMNLLLLVMVFFPKWGQDMLYVFSAGAVAWLLIKLYSLMDAGTWMLREMNGVYKRQNDEANKQKQGRPEDV